MKLEKTSCPRVQDIVFESIKCAKFTREKIHKDTGIQFHTIDHAIRKLRQRGLILVNKGRYHENLDLEGEIIDSLCNNCKNGYHSRCNGFKINKDGTGYLNCFCKCKGKER